MENMKPVLKKSKSALRKLRKWKPFKMPRRNEDFQHIFLNLSLRVQNFGSNLCDSEQEFLGFSFQNFELDSVYRPRNKLVLRTFIQKLQVEDMTQFTLFPKVSRMPSLNTLIF